MRIPVFVSRPSTLSDTQDASMRLILAELERLNLEPRTLGVSDYGRLAPLREVLVLARRCSGAMVLGFAQFRSDVGESKPNTPKQRLITTKEPARFPSPWNNLEAGVAFSLGLPLLIFREEGINGGIFDEGASEVFLYPMPKPPPSLP